MDIPVITPVLGLIYKLGVRIDRSLTRSIRLPKPVISVGNIASGGRGKTPFVNFIAQGLKSRGYEPVVLTRGYGRRDRNLRVWLLPGSKKNFSPDICGDEALEIFFRSRVPVLVGPKRFQNALFFLRGRIATEKMVFILDDGFQHWDLHRDFDLVLLRESDYKASLLPLGFLREEPKSLGRASLVLEDLKDFQKKTFMKVEIPKDKDPLILTTRVPDPHYHRYFKENCKNPFFLELRDHADFSEIVRNLHRFETDVPVVVGAKEATKIFSYGELQSFFEEGQAKKEIAPQKSFQFYFADFELWLLNEEMFWSRILSALPQ